MIWHPISEPIPESLWHKTLLFINNNEQDCTADYCIHHMLGKFDGDMFFFMLEDYKKRRFYSLGRNRGTKG